GQLYGASDIGSVTFNHPGADNFEATAVGVPMRGVSVRVLGETGEVLPAGAEGQIAVRAPSMLTRYVEGPGVPLADAHFLTGGLGRFDERVPLTTAGRMTLLVDTGGARVKPIAVKATLAERPAIARGVGTPLRMTEPVTRLRALNEPRSAPAPAADELR